MKLSFFFVEIAFSLFYHNILAFLVLQVRKQLNPSEILETNRNNTSLSSLLIIDHHW